MIIALSLHAMIYPSLAPSIDKYYLSRKQQHATTVKEDEISIPITTTVAAPAAATHKDKIIPLSSSNSKEELVESLCQLTNRRRNDVKESLDRLQNPDLKRLSELCHNYSRIQKYSKLIIIISKHSKQQKFRKEIESEIGRKLESHQLWRAVNSKKSQNIY